MSKKQPNWKMTIMALLGITTVVLAGFVFYLSRTLNQQLIFDQQQEIADVHSEQMEEVTMAQSNSSACTDDLIVQAKEPAIKLKAGQKNVNLMSATLTNTSKKKDEITRIVLVAQGGNYMRNLRVTDSNGKVLGQVTRISNQFIPIPFYPGAFTIAPNSSKKVYFNFDMGYSLADAFYLEFRNLQVSEPLRVCVQGLPYAPQNERLSITQ